ncbi:MAG TPA: tetratricopeptide repeat protein [Pseudolabrys sp.]|nr:tetratricopeptide repeat protein [Pseudolabrys sp.]
MSNLHLTSSSRASDRSPLRDSLQDNFARLQEAERLRQQGQYDRAEAICEALVRQHPDYMAALHTLGLILADQHRFAEALDCLVRAVMLSPRSWTTLTALSGIYLRLGANEMAARTVAQAMAIKPDDPNVLVALGDIYRKDREYELARDTYRQALILDESLVPAAVGLGWCHQNLGEVAESATVFEGLINRGMRLLEPIRGLANLPASAVSIDLLPLLENVVPEPGEDQNDFQTSIAFFRATGLDRAGRYAEAWEQLASANRAVFVAQQNNFVRWSAMCHASLAFLRAHPGESTRERMHTEEQSISLFILGASGSGKTTMEKLVGMLPGVKRGYENPIVENSVRWTFQAGNLPTVSSLGQLPRQLFPLFRKIYHEELARRIGPAKVFTNTLPTCIHDAARLASLVPNARFVCLKRNVEDNLLRIFMRKYRDNNSYGYNLKAARDHILWYHQMIDMLAERFPKIVRVIQYEDMVLNPSESLRAGAELCGLPNWSGQIPKVGEDVGCARPYRQFISDQLNFDP